MIKKLCLLPLLLMMSMAANALPIVQTASCTDSSNLCATGIIGLDVMGMTLDVSFSYGAYSSVYGASDPFFLGNNVGAQAAVTSMVSALDGVVFGVFSEGPSFTEILIPSAAAVDDLNFQGSPASSAGSSAWTNANLVGISNPDILNVDLNALLSWNVPFAVFNKQTTVPEPSTIALLSLVLAGLGWSRHRSQTISRSK